MIDPEYDLSQEIHHNSESGVVLSQYMRTAPRANLGESYTFDYNNKSNANLQTRETNKSHYVKYLVEEEDFYHVKLKSTANSDISLYLCDSLGSDKCGDSWITNGAGEYNDIHLMPGVYYIKIITRSDDQSGWIYF